MKIIKSKNTNIKSQIDWEAIKRRMIMMRYQPGYKGTQPAPVDGWILFNGFWDDNGEWQDNNVWKDS